MIEIDKKRIINLLTIVVLLLSYSGIWAQSGCTSMPAPTSYTKTLEEKFQNDNSKIAKIVGTAHVNGIVVTRTLENDRQLGYDLGIKYSNGQDAVGDTNPCGNNTKSKHGYPIMDSNRVRILTYEFSQPVTDIELFFAEFGYKQLSGKIDYADIELYHNGVRVPTQLAIRSDCKSGAEIKPGPRLASKSGKVTDVKAGITSNQPFDKMVLRNSNDNTGYGFYVEICFNSIRPQDTSTCTPGNINNNFAKAISATKTLNGVEVQRILDANQFADIGTASYCGSSVTYPNNLPYMGNTGARKLTYKFNQPVTSAEIFLFAFGESEDILNPNRYDKVKFSVDGGGTMTLSQTYNCIPTGTTINSSTGEVKSADDKLITTDVGIKVASTKPFTEIVLEDKTPSEPLSGKGYVVEICASSIKLADTSACTTDNIGNLFPNSRTATYTTTSGVKVTRKMDASTNFSSLSNTDYCTIAPTYPTNLPLLVNSKVMTYEFDVPVTQAEVFLFAFGDKDGAPNTYDEVTFSTDNGTVSVTQTYSCNPSGITITNGKVRSVDNRKWTTDVGLKITSTKPFTKLILTDSTPTYGSATSGNGYLVAFCEKGLTKITQNELDNFITLDATASTLTNQTVCEGEAPATYKAKATANAFASTAKFDYILEAKKSGTTNWVAVETQSNVTPGTLHTFTGDALKTTDYNNAKVRVKYVYKNSLFPSVTGAAYSNEATLTVKEKASITSLTASPTSLNETGSTNITYTIKGTPGATVTYRVTGDATDKTVNLNGSGEGTVTVNNRTSNTILTITKVEKTGLCSRENLHYKAEVDHEGSTCTSHPTPQFAKGQNAKVTLNGVEVTRTVEGTPYYYPATTYPNYFCTPTIMEGHPVMSEDGFNKITYTFAKPISKVQVWLSGFGGTGTHSDSAQFSVECTGATPNLSLSVTDCNNTAESTLVTKSGNQITSKQGKYFQAIVQVSADKPFTKLVVSKVDANSFKAGGYLVELCPTSVKLPKIAVTQDPAGQKACEAQTGISFTANAKMEGVTGNLSVQWQRTKTPATETSWANAPGTASGTVKADGTGSTTLTLSAIVAADKDYYYRALFSYNACGTAITQASDKAKLEIPSASDIITIQATQPSDVTTNNCTGTTTVNAQAKIASGYNIKNSGGNLFGYFLEFKDTDNTWKTYKLQQYSNNTSEQARTLSIAHSSAPEGTTRFRLRYSVTLTTGCDYTVTTNEFTFTKNLPAQPAITTPQTFCQSENKTVGNLTTLPNIKWYDAASGGNEVSASTTIPVENNKNYWATVTTNGCESTRKQVTVTVKPKPTTPTVQTKTECPATGSGSTYDMKNLVTSSSGNTLKWYAAATGNATTTSTVDRNKTAKTTYEKWVAQVTPEGCESDRVKVTYIVDVTTLPTITAPASDLAINCADPAATVTSQVNTWLGTATAIVGCGTPTVTNNYATVKPADLCSVGEIEVTFTVRDAFGNQNTVKKKITVDRLIANNDTESVSRSTGEDIDVLANDTKNGQPATKDNVNVQIVNANGTGATVTSDGKIRIPGGTLAPGLHNITYKICDKNNPSRCGATATLAVTITNSTIEANNDTPAPLTYATSVAYAKNTDGTELNVLANDKLSGTRPTLSQVTIIPVVTATGVSIEPATGKVKVNASTPAGVYNLTYKIKENGTSNESSPAKVTVVVKNTLNATPATLTPAITPSTSATTPKVIGDVLNQTTLNGSKPNTNQVTISVTQGATPPVAGDPVPEINTTTGKVEIPSGVKPGNYTIKYKVCDKAIGVAQTCKDVTLPITVAGGNTIVAQNDDFSANKVERSASEEVVKNGANPVNVLTNDELDSRTGLDTNVVTITQTSAPSAVNIDTATGQIKVAANATAGVYEVKYKITEKGQTTPSNEATAKVVVTNKVELTPATIPSTVNPPTNTTPKTIANVLDNAKINGSVPTTTNAKVEVVTPAPAAPGEVVPYVDPATGNVVVPPGTKVGNHPITYKVCDKVPAGQEAAQTCKTTTITIPVTGNTPTAAADDFSAHKVERSNTDKFVNDGTNDVNVLSNDALGSNTNITTALVTITPTVTNPNVSIDTDGKVRVKANAPAGEYTVKYTLTQKGGTTPSAEVPVKVVVTNKLELGPGNVPSSVKPATGNTPAEIGDVLNGTKLNGTPTTVGSGPNQVTIAVVTPATPQGSNPVPTLDPATGKVKIPAGVPAGPYTIKYKICDNATPASAKSCKENTLNINVAGNNITATADDYSTFKVEKPTAETTVKNASSQEVNVLSNDKLGTRTGLDTDVVIIHQVFTSNPSGVNIDLATGKVKVGPSATAGEHEIRYTLIEKGYTNESNQVTVKVTVTNKVEVNPATIPATVTPSTDNNTPNEIGNVLNQTRINGNTPGQNDVTITATPNAPGSPKKPYIDTTTGKVLVPAGVAPGNYPITYKICDKAPGAANTCETATITVKVAGNTITPADDDFSAHKVENPTSHVVVSDGANHVNILTNDKLGTRTGLTTNLVTITQTHTSDSRVSIDPTNGEVDVQAGTPAGIYTVKYKITEIGQPASAASAEKTVTVVVTNKLVNNNGNYGGAPSTTSTPADGGNVLDNVRINGSTSNPSPSDVTITVNVPATGTTVPYLETSGPDKGEIKLPQGTPSGTYTITYTVCDTATGAAKSCKQATATVVVDANAIIATNDTNNKDVEFNANTAQNVKGASNNDLNVLDNDKLGATRGLNNTLVTIQTTQPEANITIQPDGKVQVAAGKAAGVYELKYKIKDNANPTNISHEATVKVVVKNKLTFDPFPATPVKPSTDKNTPAERMNVLDKTKLNGNTPTINDVTIEETRGATPQSPGDKVPVLDPATGKINVPAGVKPGPYTIEYRVCDKVAGDAKTCKINTVTLTVAGNTITAVADDFTAHKVERSNTDKFVKNGTNDVNVLTNDKLDTRTGLTKDLVTITQTHTSEPKVTIEPDGRVKVAANAPAGTHTIKYRITEKGQTAPSNEVEVKVVVTNKIELDHTAVVSNPVTPSTNSTTPKEIGDVLDGTKLNGTKPTIGTGPNQVSITVTNPATSPVPGDPVPALDTTTGKVKIPAGVKPGNYNITYKVCDNATPQTCESTTVTVQVQGNTTTAVADDFSAHKVEHPTTNTFVKDGTNDVNVLSNDKLGNNSNISTNEVTITQTATSDPKVTIDTATGKVKVAANTPAGEYTVKYKFTEKGQPSTQASAEKEVKVVVTNKLVNNNANYSGAASTNSTPTNAGNVLDNVRINDATSNPAPSDVTISVDVPATGTKVPYLETSGPDAGKIKIPQGTPSGPYTIKYTVCDKAPGASKSCKQATATVTVGANPIVVNPTTKRVPKTGGSVDVLDNATIGGNPANKNNVDVSIVNDGGTGATVDPATGKINVPSGLAPGTHTITYKVCEKGSTTNCQTSTLKVVIPSDIVVNPAPNAVIPKTGGTADVLDNTTVNGHPATKDKVDVSIVNDGGTGATVDPATGKIKVPGGLAPGEYTITYKVCEKGQTDNCKTGTLKVVIPADIVLNPDGDKTVPKTGGTVDVLGNDTVNGNPATKNNVDISIVDPDGTNASIDPTGKIVIPNGAAPGTHTIRYRVCEKGTNRCKEGSVKVVVAQENIAANPDNYEEPWSNADRVAKAAGNVDANILTNDQLGSRTALNTTLVDIEQVDASSDKVSVDPATGKVTIKANTPGGTYTVKYRIKPKGQTTPVSTPATVTVVVKNKVEVTDNEISGKPSENNSPREIGNVTDNVKINGQKPSPSGVTIEVINPAAPVRPGAHVPRVDTTTGKIIVDKDVPAGDYTIKVRVCDKATPKTCVEKDLKIKVRPNQNLEAVNNEFNIGTTGGTTPSVLDNDKWKNEAGKLKTNGSDSDELKVKVVPTLGKNQPDPTRVIMGDDGRITVKPGLAPGRYTYYYTIISVKEPSMSSSAEAVINISSYIAGEDTVVADKSKEGEEVTSQESVLDNDTLNGVKPTPDNTVEISLISVSPSAKGKIELDTTTGKIKLKSGVPVGEHTVKYKVCIKGTTTCQEGEAKVKVQPNLTLKEHTFDKPINSAISETHTDSVLTGSTLDGQPIKPADVTTSIVTNGGLTGANINADGQIIIPKGAPSGTYTIEYRVKSNTYGVEKTAKVTVTINNDATLEFYNAISTDEGSQNNGFIIKNIDLYPNNNLKIFNRYGVLVYEKDGYTNADPFKGFSTGRATVNKDGKLPQGTYYYVLEYTDGQNQNQQKAGWLYIK